MAHLVSRLQDIRGQRGAHACAELLWTWTPALESQVEVLQLQLVHLQQRADEADARARNARVHAMLADGTRPHEGDLTFGDSGEDARWPPSRRQEHGEGLETHGAAWSAQERSMREHERTIVDLVDSLGLAEQWGADQEARGAELAEQLSACRRDGEAHRRWTAGQVEELEA
ncbi:unnamed protein product [Prorocentrum cordatum]|uniref:Uncharacterized protein n=1 Tax=Prorocentrum cordatum TaxID=2364126 RepID=A0ABN9Q505_9DINO|nr:unnamed protein product [Polarella glacialis]